MNDKKIQHHYFKNTDGSMARRSITTIESGGGRRVLQDYTDGVIRNGSVSVEPTEYKDKMEEIKSSIIQSKMDSSRDKLTLKQQAVQALVDIRIPEDLAKVIVYG